MTESKKICPRCFGNGYIRIPNESVEVPKQIVAQCTMCNSKGETYYEEPNFDYSGVDANKLQ